MEKITFEELIEVVEKLNVTGLVDKIDTGTVSFENLMETFLDAVAEIPEDKDAEIPKEVIQMNNRILDGVEEKVIPEEVLKELFTETKPEEAPKGKKKGKNSKKEKGAKKEKEPVKTKENLPEKSKEGDKKSVRQYLDELIKEGKSTRKELIEKTVKTLGVSSSSVGTMVTDGKNPKYNKFDKLLIQDERGVIMYEN